jgi:hypothetical protein
MVRLASARPVCASAKRGSLPHRLLEVVDRRIELLHVLPDRNASRPFK